MMNSNFFDEVHDFQRFVRQNVKLLGNYLIISEQLYMRNDETGILDMLAVDNDSKVLTIIEIKNDITTDKNVWQPIRYYDLAKRGEDDLRELLVKASSKFDYDIQEIDLTPKLLLVVPKCNSQLLRTLSYFGDIDSEVIELTRDVKKYGVEIKKESYKPRSIFHKDDLVNVQKKISQEWSFDEYLKHGINSDKVNLAKRISTQIQYLFNEKDIKFDIFFSETKITITKDKKVWLHLFIKNRILDNKLTISFKTHKDCVINKNDFIYNSSIESFTIQKSSIKLTLIEALSLNVFERYL
ncbi:gp54 [Bacillus phage G]|uniref:Gp54 n=1 Tax=Bacillus phage G TaxID=2884420 RepID=G3MBC4_9CAUD|nr:gp54 [Bacillus phage G]AEO93325.1 gp54 [Bacillus phage G]